MNTQNNALESNILLSGFIRKTQIEDIDHVAINIRNEEKEAVQASSKRTPLEAISHAVLCCPDTCYTIVNPKGTPISIFGIAPDKSGITGIIWSFSTEEVRKSFKVIYAHAPQIFAYFHSLRPLLTNKVSSKNILQIRLLKKLGAKFISETKGADQKTTFYEFVKVDA